MKTEETVLKKTKGEKTKRKLFDCAARLFAQHDFDEVSVDRIVEAAGMSKGTFYIHFDGKDTLIAAFLADYASRVDTDYRNYLASLPPTSTASQRLLGLIEKIADTLTEGIGSHSMRMVYKLQLDKVVDMATVKGYNRELYQIFAGLLDMGVQQGEFQTGLSLDVLTQHFVMAIRGISYEWCIRYPDFDLKEQALTHFKLLLTAIKADA